LASPIFEGGIRERKTIGIGRNAKGMNFNGTAISMAA